MRIPMGTKYWIFMIAVVSSMVYLFEPTSFIEPLKSIIEWKYGYLPIISTKNVLAVIFAYFGYQIAVSLR